MPKNKPQPYWPSLDCILAKHASSYLSWGYAEWEHVRQATLLETPRYLAPEQLMYCFDAEDVLGHLNIWLPPVLGSKCVPQMRFYPSHDLRWLCSFEVSKDLFPDHVRGTDILVILSRCSDLSLSLNISGFILNMILSLQSNLCESTKSVSENLDLECLG